MYALVENNQFVKILNDRKGFTGTADNIEIVNMTDEEGNIIRWSQEEIDNGTAPEGTKVGRPKTEEVVTQQPVKYSKDVFTKWTNEEREAIGVYSVTIDTTNKKDEEYYINTDITYAVSGNEVVGSYGTAFDKQLEDSYWTQQDSDDGLIPENQSIGDVKVLGLKNQKIQIVKQQAAGLLAPTDWHVIKATEVADYSVPANISAYRADVRAKSNEMEDQINACATVEDLKTLFTWVYDEDTNTTSRPLASFPEEI